MGGMKPKNAAAGEAETSFPLKRHFYRRIVPGLVLFLLTLVFLSGYSSREVMRGIYLQA